MANKTFTRRGTYNCSDCGKLTRDTGQEESGTNMCLACAIEATIINDHLDGNHEETTYGYCKDCPECIKENN